MTACSACRTILPAAASHCPNCKLPVTALAIPVLKRRTSAMSIILLGLLGFAAIAILIGHAVEGVQEPKRSAAHEALLSDLHSGRLSTPDAFQQRCGKAHSVSTANEVATLAYMNGDIRVKLEPGKPIGYYRAVPSLRHEGKDVDMPISEDFAMGYLRCE